MRQLSDGERELWNELQRDAAPDFKVLSEKPGTRRKGPILCDGCHEAIEVGQRYKTVTYLEDGTFGHTRLHDPVCPKFEAALAEGDPPAWAGKDEDLI